MENKNLDEHKTLAEQAHEHSENMLELTRKADALLHQVSKAETPGEQLELIKQVRQTDQEAIAEAHKVIELQSKLISKQRADMVKTLEDLRSKSDG